MQNFFALWTDIFIVVVFYIRCTLKTTKLIIFSRSQSPIKNVTTYPNYSKSSILSQFIYRIYTQVSQKFCNILVTQGSKLGCFSLVCEGDKPHWIVRC